MVDFESEAETELGWRAVGNEKEMCWLFVKGTKQGHSWMRRGRGSLRSDLSQALLHAGSWC
jgi:hypothetical protein